MISGTNRKQGVFEVVWVALGGWYEFNAYDVGGVDFKISVTDLPRVSTQGAE